MYVAITRARKRLYLSHSQTRMLHGQTRYHIRSRFFDELPEATLKWITPRNQGFGSGLMPSGGGASYGAGSGGRGGSGAWGGGSRGYARDAQPGWSTASGGASRPVSREQEASTGLRIGLQVFHNKFGEGTVLMLEGSGTDARAQVNFPRHGVKWLALSVAKLTPVT